MSAKGRVGSRDAIIELTSIAICGSHLHILDGLIPGMEQGISLAMNSWAVSLTPAPPAP